MPWDTSIEDAITGAAGRYGVDPNLMKTFAKIESSGNPNARTGSYKGLFQLGDNEFGKYGGGNIYDPQANSNAAAQKIAAESAAFQKQYGRAPTASDLYLTHQQGTGGYAAHMRNPDAPAWQNMYSTGEGRAKGPGWAKQAIWGNVPADVRARYPGGVDSLTSKQFMDLWAEKVARMGGGGSTPSAPNGAPMPAAPIGGAPVAGGPVPLMSPPNKRYSKLADMLLASAAGAKPQGWGDLLNSGGDLALGYTMANKADEQEKAYRGSLANALMGSNADSLVPTLLASGDPELQQQGIALKVAQQKGNNPIEVNGNLVQKNAAGKYEPVYTSPPKPLPPSDRKEVFEADEGAQAATNVLGSLDKALELNSQAYSGPGAQTRGYVTSLFGSKGGEATEALQNVVLGQVLDNLKATFGAAPTEGERQILVDLQGSVGKAPEVRRQIFENAKAAAQRRLTFNQERATALRGGTYFQPGYSPTAKAPASPAAPPPAGAPQPGGANPPAGAPAPQKLAPPPKGSPEEAAAINDLRKNASTEMRKYFNEIFGPGAAEKALGLVQAPRAPAAQPQAQTQQDLQSFYGNIY